MKPIRTGVYIALIFLNATDAKQFIIRHFIDVLGEIVLGQLSDGTCRTTTGFLCLVKGHLDM